MTTATVKIVTLLALLAVVFAPVYPDLIATWLGHSNNSHGLLVPFISLYFIWQKKGDLKAQEISSSNWGLVILVISLALYLLAYLGGVVFVMRLMIVFSLIGLVLFALGWRIFNQLAFPLVFLFFMVPVPTSVIGLVSFPLQLFATKISANIIQYCSIPVLREGNMLYFVQTQLEVAEACSGIRSIMSLTMLSVLFVYSIKSGWPQKTILLLSAIPIAVIANIIRISGTGVLAHFYGDKVARGFLHDFSGMAVFLFGLSALFLEYWLLNKYWRPQL
jgi:exosortase